MVLLMEIFNESTEHGYKEADSLYSFDKLIKSVKQDKESSRPRSTHVSKRGDARASSL